MSDGGVYGGLTTLSPGIYKLPHWCDYNQNLTVHISARKTKPVSPLRRILSSVKGKRKDKESPTPIQEEHRPYLEDDYVKEKVTDTDLNKLVAFPTGSDKNEWLATHTISFFEHINLMYGTVSEYCTSTGCASMVGPANTQYLWFDEKGKKCKCPAPQYVDYVMTFSQKTIQDETVFPTKYGIPFPTSFESIVKKIHRYLFHVLAHIYQSHYKEMLCLKLHPHLNTVFQHFMTFNRQFELIDAKEVEILDDLFIKLEGVSLKSTENTTESTGNDVSNLPPPPVDDSSLPPPPSPTTTELTPLSPTPPPKDGDLDVENCEDNKENEGDNQEQVPKESS